MDIKLCSNCGNKNPVNGTDNRLVTESCGHVKCMYCLLYEKSGCEACKALKHEAYDLKTDDKLIPHDENSASDTESVPERLEIVTNVQETVETKKDKPSKITLDTKHILFQDGYYTCTLCLKKFTARSQVRYHAYCNGQPKPYNCDKCSRSFSMRSHYFYHKRLHNNERPYSCDICGASFVQKSKLQRHKLRHTKEKKFTCEDCGKGFNNMSALRKHVLIHTGERPYSCLYCNVTFRDSSNYRKHMRFKHPDKKCMCGVSGCAGCGGGGGGGSVRTGRGGVRTPGQYACSACSHTFLMQKDLRRHMLVHSETKPHACKECGARFRRKDNYIRHIRNSHPVATNGVNHKQTDTQTTTIEATVNKSEATEKNRLEVLNPLPPLPEEIIQKHLFNGKNKTQTQKLDNCNCNNKTQTNKLENCNGNIKTQILVTDIIKDLKKAQGDRVMDKIDKSYIIQANHARESVIVSKCFDRKIPSPIPEYVHKIRKANLSNKEVTLPPIDEKKFLELTTKDRNCLDVGPLPKNVQTYKSILHDKSERQTVDGDGKIPEVHWRKKRLTDKE